MLRCVIPFQFFDLGGLNVVIDILHVIHFCHFKISWKKTPIFMSYVNKVKGTVYTVQYLPSAKVTYVVVPRD